MNNGRGLEFPCALCGARDTRRLYTKFEWGIERCRRCGLVYANPRAPEQSILARYSADYFWNEYLPAAGAPGGRIDDGLLDARHAPMLSLIRREAPAARRLLEVGSGAGLFLHAASRAGWDVVGLELSAEAASFARERLHLDVRTERAEAMSLPPQSFDVAVMFDVIEHLFDPRAVLDAARRALRPGGLLIVSTPNFNALSRRALGEAWAVLSPLEHVYYFTEVTLAKMLDASGFSGIRAIRTITARSAVEVMNFRYTHAPGTGRNRLYAAAVAVAGRPAAGLVQRAGLGDTLVCVGRA